MIAWINMLVKWMGHVHLQGYFYVEAYKEDHVKEAIRGLRSIFISKGAALVPLNEMVEALTVSSKASAASLGDKIFYKQLQSLNASL